MMLSEKEFVLVVGEPVKFDLMESSIRHEDDIGRLTMAYFDRDKVLVVAEIGGNHEGDFKYAKKLLR